MQNYCNLHSSTSNKPHIGSVWTADMTCFALNSLLLLFLRAAKEAKKAKQAAKKPAAPSAKVRSPFVKITQ